MTYNKNQESAIDTIERMRIARIGSRAKWKKLTRKIQGNIELDANEMGYLASFSKIYGNAEVTRRSKMLHVRLSKEDDRPRCSTCGTESEFYCNQNDAYFCSIHVIGHDENER